MIRFRWAGLLMMVLAGCASSDPILFTLDVRSGDVRSGDVRSGDVRSGVSQATPPRVVAVRPIALPAYLKRQEIVRDFGPTLLVAADNDWWAEPLAGMVRRVLVANLSQRLPGVEVLADGGALAATPDTELAVEIVHFEADSGGLVTLRGRFVLVSRNNARRFHDFEEWVPASSAGIDGQVVAMSDAVGRLADEVVRDLVGG